MYVLSRWVSDLPLKMDGEDCHFGNAWDRLSQSKIIEIEQHSLEIGDVYVTEAGNVQIAGEGAAGDARGLLRALLELQGKGVDPFAATWFPTIGAITKTLQCIASLWSTTANRRGKC